MASRHQPRRRVESQVLAEFAILTPLVIFGIAIALNLMLMVHAYVVLQDAVRAGAMLAMDHRLADPPCSSSCANDAVRLRMRQVGSQIGLTDSQIQLSDFWCGDSGMLAWQVPVVSWRAGQSYLVCSNVSFKPWGPFVPDIVLPLHAEIQGTRT